MAVPIRKFSSFIWGQVFRNKAYVGGRWVDSSSGRTFPVWNPSNKQLVADAPEMDQRDAEMAVEAATVAQKAWRSRSAKVCQSTLRLMSLYTYAQTWLNSSLEVERVW